MRYVVEKYGHLSADELCDLVYRTPPMLQAQARDNRFAEPLDLTTREGVPPELYDPEVAEGILEADDDELVPFDEAWSRFETTVSDR